MIKNNFLLLNHRFQYGFLGFMLVELLITLSIGLLIVSTILEIYLGNLKSYHLQRTLNQIQDSMSTATYILNKEIQHAGYIGCGKLRSDFTVNSFLSYTLTQQNRFTTLHNNEITIRHMSLSTAIVVEPMRDFSVLLISNHLHINAGDILIIADCKRADIFQVKEVKLIKGKQMIYPSSPLHYQYDRYAEVGQFEMNTYFIAPSQRKYRDGTPIYSLFMKDRLQRKTELVEGIRQMTIRYAIQYEESIIELPSSEMEQTWNVVGIAIDLKMIWPPIQNNFYLYTSVGPFL